MYQHLIILTANNFRIKGKDKLLSTSARKLSTNPVIKHEIGCKKGLFSSVSIKSPSAGDTYHHPVILAVVAENNFSKSNDMFSTMINCFTL